MYSKRVGNTLVVSECNHTWICTPVEGWGLKRAEVLLNSSIQRGVPQPVTLQSNLPV
jgi:hypothetical protein